MMCRRLSSEPSALDGDGLQLTELLVDEWCGHVEGRGETVDPRRWRLCQ